MEIHATLGSPPAVTTPLYTCSAWTAPGNLTSDLPAITASSSTASFGDAPATVSCSELETGPDLDLLSSNDEFDVDGLIHNTPRNDLSMTHDSVVTPMLTGNDEHTSLFYLDEAANSLNPAPSNNGEIDDFQTTDVGLCRPSTYDSVASLTLPNTSNDLELSALVPGDISSLVPIPSRTISTLGQASGRLISKGCRRFIISILRTYPRMMTRPDHLPPFVHPVGCGLHFNEEGAQRVNLFSSDSANFAPLKPLAACHSIALIFASRNRNSDEFLWRTIDNEHRWIMSETQQFSRGECIAAIQAMVIYTMMRLMNSGYEYFITNREMVKTMKRLGDRFSQLCPGPLSPTHERHSKPTWEDWIFEETRRRLSLVCFLTSLVLGSEGSDGVEAPFFLPLPSGKAMWEAKNAWSWEGEYGAFWQDLKTNKPRLDTLGDLATAHMQQDNRCDAGMGGSLGDEEDDVLDSWHAGVDGLGMMLAAIIADV
ncbi:hypothetical protein AK830_g2425 [Neonectria ditissima]|uniref:Transcription factor domain-containing protein n=1 Tax=Neonectria ditissima TaxID=78410 RepID=A0A0P7BS02_9HYPO|nr:hypothetical protein AK830_g2425 [Neonectria ditissima]